VSPVVLGGCILNDAMLYEACSGCVRHAITEVWTVTFFTGPRVGLVPQRLGIALLAVGLAFACTLSLQPHFPYPFLFLFFGAVMVSAWFGGTTIGLATVLMSTLLVDYFFVPPYYSFSISATAEAYFAAFVVCALAASWVSSAKRKTEEALKEALDHLEVRVSERTAELLKTQTELARLSQALSMGELTASIAHEINQPLTAVVTHGHACIEWLSATPPNLEKTRQTVERIIQDGTRAGAVIKRVRALFKKEAPTKNWIDVNEVVHELTTFLHDEATRRHVAIRTELVPGLPKVKADRVQLQQVVLNLIVNGMDAVADIADDRKEIRISTRAEGAEVAVQVEDFGTGLDAETAERIFSPFYTTKAHGTGLGLSLSRSIIEAHDGRLWVSPRSSGGAVFQFTLPIRPRDTDG